jgi:hypothetical protein
MGRRPAHGLSHTKVYRTWKAIRQRCHNPSSKDFPKYGARGIRVCKKWINSFKAFFEDMGHPPSPLHSIDRINGRKGYSPSNCRWATPQEQGANHLYKRLLTYKGITKTETEWCRFLGKKPGFLHMRIKYGFTIEDAIERPVRKYENASS